MKWTIKPQNNGNNKSMHSSIKQYFKEIIFFLCFMLMFTKVKQQISEHKKVSKPLKTKSRQKKR